MKKKYYLARKSAIVGGVCQGFENYTGVDVIFWRLAFIFTLKYTAPLYFILWFIANKQPENA